MSRSAYAWTQYQASLPEKTNTDLEYVQGQFILAIGDYLK